MVDKSSELDEQSCTDIGLVRVQRKGGKPPQKPKPAPPPAGSVVEDLGLVEVVLGPPGKRVVFWRSR